MELRVRTLVLVGMFLGCLGVAPSVMACDPHGGDAVVVVVSASATLATRQSQTLLSDADTLDAKADIEEGASASVVATAKIQRRRAAAIRVQAFQTPEPSQSALLARAAKLNADAAANEASSKTFLARAKVIRSRADALRALSTRVLASGVVTTQVLPAVQLLAPPAGHPDRTALVSLEAAPRVARRPMMSVAGI